jgi:hypothetical protein
MKELRRGDKTFRRSHLWQRTATKTSIVAWRGLIRAERGVRIRAERAHTANDM